LKAQARDARRTAACQPNFVTRGSLRLRVGESSIALTEGGLAYVPPGTVHTFANPSDEPTTFLVWLSPGGMEAYFVELAELMKTEPVWPPADRSRVIALMAKYDQQLA
jgi:hypothetical protein